MMLNQPYFISVLLAALTYSFSAKAAPPVLFSKQVLPLLRSQCMSCHGGANPVSGYSMESRDRLISGGRHGAAIITGKGAQSSLILYMTGELKPKMPPGGAIDLEKITIIRKWIDEGSKVDTMIMPVSAVKVLRPVTIPPAAAISQSAPVTTIAYSPDGIKLAVGGYRAVRILNPLTGELIRKINGPADQVQSVSWSSDGKYLAAAGGLPGQSGEVIIFETESWKPIKSLVGHTEVVYAVTWKPGATEIATGSLDKTVRIWDALTGQSKRTLKDHADGVFSVAYSPDGKYLATGSADRSAKLFDTSSWKRVASLTAHQDSVTHVSFNHNGTLLATTSADRQMHIWKVEIGKMENPARSQGEGDVINCCAFSPDGSLLAWGASNRVVKVFNGDGSGQKREMKEAGDWVYAVAIGKDNQTVAAGTQDGKILFWDVKAGKLLRTVTLTQAGAKVELAAEVKK